MMMMYALDQPRFRPRTAVSGRTSSSRDRWVERISVVGVEGFRGQRVVVYVGWGVLVRRRGVSMDPSSESIVVLLWTAWVAVSVLWR